MNAMNRWMRGLAIGAAAVAIEVFPGPFAFAEKEKDEKMASLESSPELKRILDDWPEAPKKAAMQMIGKYGMPDETGESLLCWRDNGPWKYTKVHKEEVEHRFPKKHVDVLEQAIGYEVPPEKFDELARFDGSVAVHRTKGELVAMCDKEEMNFLALNLAHDIITGKRSVDDARAFFARTAGDFMKGQRPAYTQELQFKAGGRTADPDESVDLEDLQQ